MVINAPDMDQLEAFLGIIDVEDLYQAHEDTTFGFTNTAFCVSCGEEHDDDTRVTDQHECPECGEEAVYPVEQLLVYCEELGVL